MSREAMKLALEALENSIDLVSQEARNAEELYGKYPTRLARIQGLVAFEVAHEKAITALREALAEQPAQQVVDSEEKAGAYMEERLWEFIDMAAAWPKASPDPRTWDHVVVYAPKPAQRTWVGLTDEEMRLIDPDGFEDNLPQMIQQALKEKNT